MDSHSNKQILREGLFPREEDLCPPVFPLPPACLVIFLPAGSFPVAYLLADWKAFRLKCGTTGVPCLTTNKAFPPPHPTPPNCSWQHFQLMGPIFCHIDAHYWPGLWGEFFFLHVVWNIKKRKNKQSKTPKLLVLRRNTLSGRMTYFYLMTLFINCLFPIKIRNWGHGKKSLNFGLKLLEGLFFGKIGLANMALLKFPC